MKLLLASFLFLLVAFPLVSANVHYVTLPYKRAVNPLSVEGTANVNFQVNDSSGNPIGNALIVVQGISDQTFSKNLLTDANGQASISLNTNEIFVYSVYKTSYSPSTGNFFTNSGKSIQVTLDKIPSDQWYLYYETNGDVSIRMNSLDKSINYVPGEYMSQVVQVTNVGASNVVWHSSNDAFIIVDNSTLHQLGWWGNPMYGVSVNLTLKPNGWVKVTSTNESSEICVGNAIGEYAGQKFDVSGSEFVCQSGGNSTAPVPVPNWILNGAYRLKINLSYTVNNDEKSFGFMTQGFNVINGPWHPIITSTPSTQFDVNNAWTYQMAVDTKSITNYNTGFIMYGLSKAPEGMIIDPKTGLVSWTPSTSGMYNISLMAYHLYFVGDSRMAFSYQNFTLDVINPNANLYADNLYDYNVGKTIYPSFTVHNDDDKANSFNYKINWGDGSSSEYPLNNVSAGGSRNVMTSHKYANPGTYDPELIIDPEGKIYEDNKNDNIKYFGDISIN
jgi:hypothetical protein